MQTNGAILRQCINWALAALWMAVIFMFSAQTGDESGGLSTSISAFLLELARKISPGITLKEIESAVRSLAHLSVYLVLGFLFMNAIVYRRRLSPALAAVALACCFIYAVSDEFHQSLVPGRVMDAADIAVDTVGACIGIAFRWYIEVFIRRGSRAA